MTETVTAHLKRGHLNRDVLRQTDEGVECERTDVAADGVDFRILEKWVCEEISIVPFPVEYQDRLPPSDQLSQDLKAEVCLSCSCPAEYSDMLDPFFFSESECSCLSVSVDDT